MRLTLGSLAPDFTAESIGGRRVSLDQLRGRPLLLKFYRFATCPVCNLHMHRFIQEHHLVDGSRAHDDRVLPLPRRQAGERPRRTPPRSTSSPTPPRRSSPRTASRTGLRGLVSPAVMRDYVKALAAGYPPGLFSSDGGITGNPADFIVDASGRIALAHYGTQYADSLDAPDAVQAWRAVQDNAPRQASQLLATA